MANLIRAPIAAPGGSTNVELLVQTLRLLPAESLMKVLQQLPPEFLKIALEMRASAPPASAPTPAAEAAPQPLQQPAPNPADKRRSPRHRTLRGAKIIYSNRMSVVDAQVRDISDGGCRIRVATAAHLPMQFLIQIAGMPGEKRCEVRWRNDAEVGVRFAD